MCSRILLLNLAIIILCDLGNIPVTTTSTQPTTPHHPHTPICNSQLFLPLGKLLRPASSPRSSMVLIEWESHYSCFVLILHHFTFIYCSFIVIWCFFSYFLIYCCLCGALSRVMLFELGRLINLINK